jgi:hypothetical protein
MEIVAVIAELDLGEATARVVLDREGDAWLLLSRTDEHGQLLIDHRPHQVGLDGDRELVAGRLPVGAVSAEVVSPDGRRVPCVVGPGAWLGLLRGGSRHDDFRSVAVLFRDRDGAPLVVSLPADWPREPVTDTEVPCPACGRCEWDVVTAAWEGIGELRTTRWGYGSSGPGRALVCRVCGHEERLGTVMRLGGPLPAHCVEPPEVQARRRRESEEAERLSRQLVLRAAEFPVFGAEGRSGRMTGSSSHGDDVGSVRVTHGSEDRGAGPRIDVRSAIDDDPQGLDLTAVAGDALADSLFSVDPSEEEQDGAFVLSIRVAQRSGRERALAAPLEHVTITVDGVPTPFVLVRSGNHWAAVARVNATIVTLTAIDLDPGEVRLRVISDPETALA